MLTHYKVSLLVFILRWTNAVAASSASRKIVSWQPKSGAVHLGLFNHSTTRLQYSYSWKDCCRLITAIVGGLGRKKMRDHEIGYHGEIGKITSMDCLSSVLALKWVLNGQWDSPCACGLPQPPNAAASYGTVQYYCISPWNSCRSWYL